MRYHLFRPNSFQYILFTNFPTGDAVWSEYWHNLRVNKLYALSCVFISFLYMFRATQCSSSGESIVSIHHLVWLVCVGGRLVCRSERNFSELHTRRPLTQSDIYQMLYSYNWFSWWWAVGCSKRVEEWNKHKKKCVKLVINTNYTEMRDQQNVKFWHNPIIHN